MALTRGQVIGNYEIVDRLGAGAMGEVYRARDQRLGRDVALKVLQDGFAADRDRRARFEKEARVAAALNHPNIVGLYDIGEHEGQLYMVTELIEGKTLRERMGGQALPVKELYRMAVQLAEGVAAAHGAGIVHRDLKPENVMVTGDGRVKILDFGLARQGGSGAASDATATMALGATEPGTVMGTATYMSPEQVRGEAVDYRSDQFSLGTMIYEMATGVSPFLRETAVQTMSAVLTDEPKRMEAGVPAPLQWTIGRCMEKDAAGRYESTRDLAWELRGQQEHLSEVFVSGVAPGVVVKEEKRKRSLGWVWGLVAGVAFAGVGFWALAPGKAEMKHTPMEVTWANPSPGYGAPDGKAFAYGAEVDGIRQVFVRYLDAPVPVQLTRLEAGAVALGWSADSRRVMFASRNTKGPKPPNALFTVPVAGGEPEWVQSMNGAGGALSPDGRMVAELRREETGGVGLYLTTPLGGTAQKYQPWPIESKAFFNSTNLRFAPDGKAVWLWFDPEVGRQLWRFPLPAGSGSPQRMLEKEMPEQGGTPSMSFLGGERQAVVALQDGLEEDATHLWMVDLQSGKRERLTEGAARELFPSVSPDGARLLYLSGTSKYRVVSMSLEDASVKTVISSGRMVGMPGWAAGQEKFAYVTNRNGAPAVWVRENGADRPLVTAAAFAANPVKWFLTPALSPDGGRAIFVRSGLDSHRENWISSLSGGPPIRLTSNGPEVIEYGGSWSPDASQFVFLQIQNGKQSLAVAKTSGEAAATILRSDSGGSVPQWSPDGKWIKFFDGKRRSWVLVSPDGKEERVFADADELELTFSKDSTKLYGIRSKDGRHSLFSVDIATKAEREIGVFDKENLPRSPNNPGVRLSLSPDGKRILYSTLQMETSIWMLEGFR